MDMALRVYRFKEEPRPLIFWSLDRTSDTGPRVLSEVGTHAGPSGRASDVTLRMTAGGTSGPFVMKNDNAFGPRKATDCHLT